MSAGEDTQARSGWVRFLGFFVDNPFVVAALLVLLVGAGLVVEPFGLGPAGMPRHPVPVDALPDTGENQQIVFTPWPGRSPRDVEDQISYPLTTRLMGIAGVRTVRSSSMFGFSSLYVIFEDDAPFYPSRSRILEKLASLPPGTLPDGAQPTLGPDATALGQVFWYTLEGHDAEGVVVGGFDLDVLRSTQDWMVRDALQSVPGVAEVASVGGFVRTYQVDVDPVALAAHDVSLAQVARAVSQSNGDVGARTLELNGVEYVVRGLGRVRDVAELAGVAVASRDGVPVRVSDVAHVTLGPAPRRGALDDGGAPTVGGVVVARYGANAMAVIAGVKEKLAALAPGLPKRTLDDGRVAQVTVVPFYDRSTLINETLGTLSTALWQQILVTLAVVLVMLRQFRGALLVASVLPLGVLAAFLAMKHWGVDANIMALGGIAIAIGTMVDMGIVLFENIARRLERASPDRPSRTVVVEAAAEVAPAVLTSVLTTVVSFLPVFGLTASEGKMFAPLAYTKSFAMLGALGVALVVLPVVAHAMLRRGIPRAPPRLWLLGIGVLVLALTWGWMPLGETAGLPLNVLFAVLVMGGTLAGLLGFQRLYPALLRACLARKRRIVVPALLLVLVGLGIGSNLGREFMPSFDEGSFLVMPTTMPHASMTSARELLEAMDARIAAVPEVSRVVGKLGRVESALDPAPISMFETVVNYLPEYGPNADGERVRLWRDHIRSPRDIWDAIARAAAAPGLTGAPMLMPMETRRVMLQSGMRAPLGLKVYGPDLETLAGFGRELETILKTVPGVRAESVFADQVVGKPYLEVALNRPALARHGLTPHAVNRVLEWGVGGKVLTHTVEGRARYPVRLRFMREARDSVEALRRVPVSTPSGAQIPLEQLADFRYVKGPQVIKSEDTFLTSTVLFDKQPGIAEVTVVAAARAALETATGDGRLRVPEGARYRFAGTYENQLRSEKRLAGLVPLALVLVFLLLYLQFRRVSTTLIIYSGVLVCVAGGFVLLGLYGADGVFLALPFGDTLGEVFRIGPVNMSVAVWVGFIALVGIATDSGVVLAAYLAQSSAESPPRSLQAIRARAQEAGERRVRACVMTLGTTVLALLPVITSGGRGADLMRPMALPVLGGMGAVLLTLVLVPVLYAWVEERRAT